MGNSYRMLGGIPATGEIDISGNKNAALPCIAATLLTDDEVILRNIPSIEDVHVMCSLLKSIGSKVEWLDENTLRIQSGSRKGEFDPIAVDRVRGSILLTGPLLAISHKVEIPPPGGDVIGLRRLDTHFAGLTSLGAGCTLTEDGIIKITCDRLVGTRIFQEEASVTGTENLIMACALAEGESTIINAACEPHVQDLCRMLIRMGSRIEGVGSNVLHIEGKKKLSGCEFRIGSDFMEVGSFIGLAAVTRGEVLLHHVDIDNLNMIRLAFNRIGIDFRKAGESDILIPSQQDRRIRKSLNNLTAKIDDAPWPGFPADLLSIITICSTQMEGTILVHEKLYESRMYFIDWLIRMGADIILCDPHRAVVNGPKQLHGSVVTSPDVRAGMALVIAASCARGESTIQNIYQIERGYEHLETKLRSLGLSIERI